MRRITWQTDGITSTTKIIQTNSVSCSECGGIRGHFNDCSMLKYELEKM